MNLPELNALENSLIKKFGAHETFIKIEKMGKNKFMELLLQKRFHSLTFTPLYDISICGMENMQAKKIARAILHEEYPAKTQSHREDLFEDLVKIGILKSEILNSRPTAQTISTITDIFNLLKMQEGQELYDIKVLTTLRFWGEVLVSEEYAYFVKKLAELGLPKEKSRFYWPHYIHDKKSAELDDMQSDKRTHADRLTIALQQMLDSEEKRELCAQTEKRIFEIKSEFYDQFK